MLKYYSYLLQIYYQLHLCIRHKIQPGIRYKIIQTGSVAACSRHNKRREENPAQNNGIMDGNVGRFLDEYHKIDSAKKL
jgi:hypothetical protein